MNYIFKFKDIDDDKCKVEVDTLVLSVKITGENRKMSYYTANSKNKLFKILRNNIGNMPRNTYRDYIKFIEKIYGTIEYKLERQEKRMNNEKNKDLNCMSD